MKLPLYQLDAFTNRLFGGTKAADNYRADSINRQAMSIELRTEFKSPT